MADEPELTPAQLETPLRRKHLPWILQGVAKTIYAFVGEEIAKATLPLKARIAALEARPEMKYLGTHKEGHGYSAGSAVTSDGSIWICLKATTERPGMTADWQLACKRGADADDRRTTKSHR